MNEASFETPHMLEERIAIQKHYIFGLHELRKGLNATILEAAIVLNELERSKAVKDGLRYGRAE